MTLNQKQQTLNVKWKAFTCNQGEKCWCRIIKPEVEILDEEGQPCFIIPSGAIDKYFANYIVALHNATIK
jgi:hypothetical protein